MEGHTRAFFLPRGTASWGVDYYILVGPLERCGGGVCMASVLGAMSSSVQGWYAPGKTKALDWSASRRSCS